MLQVRDGKKIAALGTALRPFPAVAARFDGGDCSFEHAVLIVAFCESPPKGMPDEALPKCIDLLLAAASGVEATTTKVRSVVATLERVFESDEITPAEDIDRNRSEEHTSESKSLMRISYADYCLHNKNI